jgi:hypothetical protein
MINTKPRGRPNMGMNATVGHKPTKKSSRVIPLHVPIMVAKNATILTAITEPITAAKTVSIRLGGGVSGCAIPPG